MQQLTSKKILSIFLCAMVLTSALLICVFAVTNEEFAVTYRGETAQKILFSETDKVEVALKGIPHNAALQWQIRAADGETWINISGQTCETLAISRALVGSIMDQLGNTAVRCVATQGENQFITDPVPVQMSFVLANDWQGTASTQQQVNVSYNESNKQYFGAPVLNDPVDASTTVTITVHYKYNDENGKTVFKSFGGQIRKGDRFWTTIASPTVPGYAPGALSATIPGVSLNGNGDVEFVLDSVTEDITITVYYTPIEVEYRVSYYLQNIDNDLYTYVETKTYTGLTDTEPTDGIVNYDAPGFSLLRKHFENDVPTIAADGSTHVNCYFDRNYYLVNFQLDGGYGTEPVYARYETKLIIPNPVRAGYTFVGWDLISIMDEKDNLVNEHSHDDGSGGIIQHEITYNNGVADTMNPAIGICVHNDHLLGNYTYKALWDNSPTTFTVVYWVQDANNPGAFNYAHSISNVHTTTGEVVNLDKLSSYQYEDENGNMQNVEVALPSNNPLVNYSTLFDDITDAGLVTETYKDEYGTHKNSLGQMEIGVQIQGDGSSVVNVYYARHEYTFWFVYMMKTSDGKYYIANKTGTSDSGYTYKSGASATPTGRDFNNSAIWTQEVSADAAQNVIASAKDTGEYSNSGNTYYYIPLTARYRQNLDDLWPKSANADSSGALAKIGNFACVGWCVDKDSPYANNRNLGSAIINGEYSTLDDQLVIDPDKISTSSNDFAGVNHILIAHWTTDQYLWEYRIYVGVTNAEEAAESGTYITKVFSPAHDKYWTRWKFVASYRSYSPYSSSDNLYFQPRATLPGIMYTARELKWEDLNGDGVNDPVLIYYYYRNEYSLVLDNYGEKTQYAPTPKPTSKGTTNWGFNGDWQWHSNDQAWYLYNSETAIDAGVSIKDKLYDSGTDTLKEPKYPSTLEPDAYFFDGWYTGPDGTGEKVLYDSSKGIDAHESGIWYNPTMPDDDLILFAYWKPITRTVKFYTLYSDIGDPTKAPIKTMSTDHGSTLYTQDLPADPDRGEGYSFVGWFYIDENGEKSVFHIKDMVVRQDLELFAEWRSTKSAAYTVYYLEKDTNKVLASPTTGTSFVGVTKTFTAKYGNELEAAGTGKVYFPDSSSKSIMITEDGVNEVYFYYTAVSSVQYTVRYLDVASQTQVKEVLIAHSENAIITVTANPVVFGDKTYIPLSNTITRVLSTDESQNIITFYYMEENENGGVQINYYVEDLNGNYAYHSNTYFTKPHGTAISVSDYLLSFTGFEWDNGEHNSVNPINGVVQKGGILELDVFIRRKVYDYSIKYMAANSTLELKSSENSSAKYGHIVSKTLASAEQSLVFNDIKYTLSSEASRSITITEDPTRNVIIFYFEPLKTSLTIVNHVIDSGSARNDVFLFKINGPKELSGTNGDIELIVAIQGNGQVEIGDLPDIGLYAGTYTVTPITSWSYLYSLTGAKIGSTSYPSGASFEILLDEGHACQIDFTFQYIGSDWLGEETYDDNELSQVSSYSD